MTFAAPWGLALTGLALPVLAMHMLKPRRRPVAVASVYLWRTARRNVSSASPWQRLRVSPLLVAQLAAVVLFAVVVAEPRVSADVALSRHTVFIVDASGSMLTLDGPDGVDRLAEARSEARRLRGEFADDGVASIVVAGIRPQVVLSASSDRDAFDAALDGIEAAPGHGDPVGAFRLAESLDREDADVGFVFLSDGGLNTAEQNALPAGTRYARVGRTSENRAVAALSLEARPNGLVAHATMQNTGPSPAAVTVRFEVDGVTSADVPVQIPAGATAPLDVDLAPGERVEAVIDQADAYEPDDRALAVAQPPRRVSVLLAGEASPFLRALLASIPGASVEEQPGAPSGAGFDVVVYNGVDPPSVPAVPFLAIAPPTGAPGVRVLGTVDAPVLSLVSGDRIVAGLDLGEVAIGTAQQVAVDDGEVLLGGEAVPLLARIRAASQRGLYLAMRLEDSNLALVPAFPLLGTRIIADLSGTSDQAARAVVGEPLPVRVDGRAVVADPRGNEVVREAGVSPPLPETTGFWTVEVEGRPDQVVAVNVDPTESSVGPAVDLAIQQRTRAFGTVDEPGTRSARWWFVLALLGVLAVEAVLAGRAIGVPRRQWRLALAARALIAAGLVAALLGITIARDADRVAVVFLVDGSASVGARGLGASLDWVRRALADQPDGSVAGVALFGGDARLEASVRQRLSLDRFAATIDPTQTDLAGGLRLAAGVLPTDARRRVVLLSDGRATAGDVDTEASALRDDGIAVDVHLIARDSGADTAVTAVDLPATVRPGEQVPVVVRVDSTVAGPARVTLLRDSTPVQTVEAQLQVGENQVTMSDVAPDVPVLRYQATVVMAGDQVAENDVGFGAVPVSGTARVLMVEGSPGEAEALAAAERSTGVTVDVVAPGAVPDLEGLSGYQAVVLVDVDAASLANAHVDDLSAFTKSLGRGLVVVGGDHAYALGGYKDSRLEELLPVISDVTDPKRKLSVAQVLAMDTSGSMGACHCGANGNGLLGGNGGVGMNEGGVTKTAIAKAAAQRTIDTLGDGDQVGVLSIDNAQHWVLDVQPLPSREEIDRALDPLAASGGTSLVGSLASAADRLVSANAALKHVILFTDGFTGTDSLAALATEAGEVYAKGVTVSVLATGEGAAQQLQAVAEAGHGRFYPGTDLSAIPQIMVQESIIASRNFVNEGEFLPEVTSSNAAVRGLTETPPLLGFVATTAKPSASTSLRVGPERDPLLATWQAGLGRVTAWTSDASARWSKSWAAWRGYSGFWAAVIKDTFAPSPDGGSVRARVDGDRIKVTVDSADPWPDGSNAKVTVSRPGGATVDAELKRTGANEFSATIDAADAGSFAVGATVEANGTTVFSATGLVSRSYPGEYQLGEARRDVLERVSTVTGGRGEIEAARAFDPAGLRQGRAPFDLAGWLVWIAALAWPVAIALSRISRRTAPRSAGGAPAPAPAHAHARGTRRRRLTTGLPGPARRSTSPSRSSAPSPPPPPTPPPPPPPPEAAPKESTVSALLEAKRRRGGGGPPGGGSAPTPPR